MSRLPCICKYLLLLLNLSFLDNFYQNAVDQNMVVNWFSGLILIPQKI